MSRAKLMVRWGLAFVAASVIALVLVPPVDVHDHAEVVGSGVPDLSLRDLEGRELTSASWRGRVTIVNFWATWCAPCRVEIPEFMALERAHQGRVQVVGLSMDESEDEVRAFVKEHGMTYPVAIVNSDVAERFGGVLGLPTTFVLDPEGRIVGRHVGLVSMDVYREAIAKYAPGSPDR
jgi:thiol-disulfide isomerase/thioredoxin